MYKRLLASSQYRVPPTGDVAAYNGTTNLPVAPDNAMSAKLAINVGRATTLPSSLLVFKVIPVFAEPDIVTSPKKDVDPVTANDPEIIALPVYGNVGDALSAYDAEVAKVANDELRAVIELDDETANDAEVANDELTASKT